MIINFPRTGLGQGGARKADERGPRDCGGPLLLAQLPVDGEERRGGSRSNLRSGDRDLAVMNSIITA